MKNIKYEKESAYVEDVETTAGEKLVHVEMTISRGKFSALLSALKSSSWLSSPSGPLTSDLIKMLYGKDRLKGTIKAEVHTDDNKKSLEFNAVPFFLEASQEEINALAKCDWGGDYPADAVARFCNATAEVLDWAVDHECGFECYVNEQSARKWLQEYRPEIKL